MVFDIAIVGKGLVGSAAARYLSAAGLKIVIIGPDEPSSLENRNGVFASHYDAGRLVYHCERDPLWARLAASSMNVFSRLQTQSGINFYQPTGCLSLLRNNHTLEENLRFRAVIEKEFKIGVQHLDEHDGFVLVCPGIEVPQGFVGIFEPAPSGHINPRQLITAQMTLAERQGVHMVRDVVESIKEDSQGVRLSTRESGLLEANTVLVAVGSFSQCFNLLPIPLDLRAKSEIITLGEVSPEQAEMFGHHPVLCYDIESEVLDDVYLVPPVRYPDGRFYFKLGSNTTFDRELPNLEAIQAWMRSSNGEVFQPQRNALCALFPTVHFEGFSTRHCLISRTPNGLPYIDQISERRFAALGCNGVSAMSSDGIARLASQLILGQPWEHHFARSSFRAVKA
jgi:glycine/D-amino acid oxidase-like deaminating enzyme